MTTTKPRLVVGQTLFGLSFGTSRLLDALPGWRACYGTKHEVAACIGIQIEK